MMVEEQVSEQVQEAPITEATSEDASAITLTDEEFASLLASAPEKLEAVLGKLPEDRFSQHPWVQKQMSRLVTKKTQELAAEQRTAAETARRASEEHSRNLAWAQDLLTRVAASTGPQLLQHSAQNPNIYNDISRAQRIVASGNNPAAFSREEYAREAYGKVKDRLKERYADVNYDDAKEIEDLIEMATEANVSMREKTLRDELTKEMDAKFTELKNALHLDTTQPDRLPPVGGRSNLSLASYLAMSSTERDKLRREHPEQVDAMTR